MGCVGSRHLRSSILHLLSSLFRPLHGAREDAQQYQAGSQDQGADQVGGSDPAPKIVLGIITSEDFHQRANESVAYKVGSKDLSIEFLTPVEPGQRCIKDQV